MRQKLDSGIDNEPLSYANPDVWILLRNYLDAITHPQSIHRLSIASLHRIHSRKAGGVGGGAMKIGVVGLGLAGLRTAMLIERAGAEALLFEAREQVGGRLRTVMENREWDKTGADRNR
jgi:heterodisulfide reductase subunit A-like polyferredoxin